MWLAEVDRILKKGYCIGYSDAGWSDEDIERYFRYEMAPDEFVRWYAEKYALIEFEGSLMRRG
jgi:hypothetical protein